MATVLEILKKYTQVAPVDVDAVAKELGIHVVRDYLVGISGKIQKDSRGKYTIVVNASDAPSRQRFTIAHEIAHFLYHRDLIGDGVSDSPAYRSPDERVYDNTPLEKRHEVQANQFAANLLMPKELVRSLEMHFPGLSDAELADRLGVSLPAFRVRKGLPPYPDAQEAFGAVNA